MSTHEQQTHDIPAEERPVSPPDLANMAGRSVVKQAFEPASVPRSEVPGSAAGGVLRVNPAFKRPGEYDAEQFIGNSGIRRGV